MDAIMTTITKRDSGIRALIREVLSSLPKIYVLVGPPGIGKSGWIESNTFDPYIISRDALVDAVREPIGVKYDDLFRNPKYQPLQNTVQKMLKDRIAGAIESGRDIVVDMTNMSAGARRNALKTISGREPDYEKVAVVFDHRGKEDEVIASVERRAARLNDKNIPRDVMLSMFSNFEYPSVEEGFDSIITASTEPALGI
jgi:predicted kinase